MDGKNQWENYRVLWSNEIYYPPVIIKHDSIEHYSDVAKCKKLGEKWEVDADYRRWTLLNNTRPYSPLYHFTIN